LHDNDGSSDQHRLPGEGKADWPEIVGILKGSAYRGTVNLELYLPANTDLATFCRKAYSTLEKLWAAGP
jgi:sugar phosphate isomerase/epimerase